MFIKPLFFSAGIE